MTADEFNAIFTSPHVVASLRIISDMLMALFLGVLFGYERSFHGRAAGMRTYGLVCMVAAVLTSISGLSYDWYDHVVNLGPIDPTRTVQGIVTGIGFLGAGIIMKDGMNITGLTTAASIWAAAAIGVLVGFGYYSASFVLTVFASAFIVLGAKFETLLPSRRPVSITLVFQKGFAPDEDTLRNIIHQHGYSIARGSISMQYKHGMMEWRFVAASEKGSLGWPTIPLAKTLTNLEGIDSFHITRARN